MPPFRKLCIKLQVLQATTLLLLCASLGCSKPQGPPIPELAEVTGRLTVNDKPAAGVNVVFTPVEAADPSFGTTAEDGTFLLRYRGTNTGAAPGKHRVQFQLSGADARLDTLPVKYRNTDSGITVEVKKSETNDFKFDLKGK